MNSVFGLQKAGAGFGLGSCDSAGSPPTKIRQDRPQLFFQSLSPPSTLDLDCCYQVAVFRRAKTVGTLYSRILKSCAKRSENIALLSRIGGHGQPRPYAAALNQHMRCETPTQLLPSSFWTNKEVPGSQHASTRVRTLVDRCGLPLSWLRFAAVVLNM